MEGTMQTVASNHRSCPAGLSLHGWDGKGTFRPSKSNKYYRVERFSLESKVRYGALETGWKGVMCSRLLVTHIWTAAGRSGQPQLAGRGGRANRSRALRVQLEPLLVDHKMTPLVLYIRTFDYTRSDFNG